MLVDKLRKERQDAAKTNKVKRKLLTTLLGEAENRAKLNNVEISDSLIQKLAKKFSEANEDILKLRPSEKLVEENAILKEYLPPQPRQMSDDEIRDAIIDSKRTSIKEIMVFLAENFKGQFDGKKASQIARDFIQ